VRHSPQAIPPTLKARNGTNLFVEKRQFSAILLILPALLFAGCIQGIDFQNGTISIEVPDGITGTVVTPAPTAGANANASSNQTQNASVQAINLPDSINICIYGDRSAAGAQYEGVLADNLTLVEFNKSIALVPKWLGGASGAPDFIDCSVIIAKDDAVGQKCGRVARDEIKLQVQTRRTGFILTQGACSLDEDDPAVQGWDFRWKGFLPLKMDCPHNDPCTLGTETVENAKFVIDDPYDPAIGDAKNFNVTNLTITITNQDENGKIAAYVRTDPTKTTEVAYAALVRKSAMLPTEGYLYYFAYDPLRTKSILRRVVELEAIRSLIVSA
jgi:hypothetical protein